MKRRLKSKSNIYTYLQNSGVLENGSHEEIQNVRKEYWKAYKRIWRKNKRNTVKEITISFLPDEFKEITNEYKRHKLSRTEFIKQACFAYMNKTFLVPDVKDVRKISQLLAMTYNSRIN